MTDFKEADAGERFSLNEGDLSVIRNALPQLHGRWSLVTEFGDEGELYGRLMPAWGNSRYSAFLLEREDQFVILTDNLSELDRCAVSSYPNAAVAMAAVQRLVQDAEADRRAHSSGLA